MRFNPQEISGSRVRLRYSVDLHYDVEGPAEFLLNVHAAKTTRQVVVDEHFRLSPEVEFLLDSDSTTGNRIAAFSAMPGTMVANYTALVVIEHRVVDPADIIAEGPASLPMSTLRYMYPSRYCQADLIQQRVWDMFGHMPRGYAQVRAVRDWVQQNFRFQVGVSSSTTSAIETLRVVSAFAGTLRTR